MKDRIIHLLAAILVLVSTSACAGNGSGNANTTATSTVTPPPVQRLDQVPRPQKLVDEMRARGEQDQAQPVLRIISPAEGAQVSGPTVQVRLALSGDLKGYQPQQDPETGTGNHIHVILDNNPYEAYYDLSQPFELKNVAPGPHVLRVFASRPWHESYKNEGSFQMVTFTVRGDDETSRAGTNTNASAETQVVPVDPEKPILTYSRPKGEYKGEDANAIMIDFWLANAKLRGDGGEYRVRYIIDDDEPRLIDKWEPIWLANWINGEHSVRLELLGPEQKPVRNGSFNVTTREITVVK